GTKQQQVENEADAFFFSNLNTPKTIGGKASLQPKRTPVSNQEMEAILVISLTISNIHSWEAASDHYNMKWWTSSLLCHSQNILKSQD
ncbi:hypothetical protein HID58_078093, partial [Brassica napus]